MNKCSNQTTVIIDSEIRFTVERFDAYEIHGVREFGRGKSRHCEQVPDGEAQFWSLYGHIPGQGLECIGDFKTRRHAEEIYSRISGRPYHDQPQPKGE